MLNCRITQRYSLIVAGVLYTLVFGPVAVCLAQDEGPQQSTTGPVPPYEVVLRDITMVRIAAEAVGVQHVIAGVPAYLWRHGCGPTAVGMVMGYYDEHGYSNLVPGSASSQTDAVNQMIASGGTSASPMPAGQERHYEDYARPEDESPTLRVDDCIARGRAAHASNCVADFMDTSRSTRGNYYGWSWSSDISPAFIDYVNQVNPAYSPSVTEYMWSNGSLTWSVLTNEIDNNRPMVFMVDCTGDGITDHLVTVIGYDNGTPRRYGCLDTWDTVVRWETFQGLSSTPWGISGGYSFSLAPAGPTVPTGVEASDGEYTDRIRVTWNSVVPASGYEVYRGMADDPCSAESVAVVDGGSNTLYDDTSAPSGGLCWYWVRAFIDTGYSGCSNSDSGYRQCTSPPSITEQPGPAIQTIEAGQTACYSVAADGTGLVTYQWQRDGNDVPWATDPSYVVREAGFYRCIVSNACGSETSDSVELLVKPANGKIVVWGDQVAGTDLAGEFVQMAAGESHSLALRADGSIAAWGKNDYGQATPPSGTDFMAIAAGKSHNLALRADGSIAAWGKNDYGQATPPDGNDFTAIAAGGSHCLALRADGSIAAWGRNDYGQSMPPDGNDFTTIAAGLYHSLALRTDGSIVSWGFGSPKQAPPSGTDFTGIAAGYYHSLALRSNGSIVAWGDNTYGQSTPPGSSDFTAIVAGSYYSLALRADGRVAAWGLNNYGQSTPPDGNDFAGIAAGWAHGLALRDDGSIAGWGCDDYGQARPPSGMGFAAIAAGGSHNLALRSDGSIKGWGQNGSGQAMPLDGNGFTAIAAGDYHSLALRPDGSIAGWGQNGFGQATPPDGNGFTAIAAGGSHSLALKADAGIAAWGSNGSGQATPPSGTGFKAIAAGSSYSLALRADNSIAGWGDNSYGQATPPSGTDFAAIAAGGSHGLALRADGSIVGWGRNNYGQATPPNGNDFVAIAAGVHHSLALRADGSVTAWGRNSYGQATPPSGTGFVAIAGRSSHSLALRGPVIADIDEDSYVTFSDLALFGVQWMRTGCSDPDWCAEADFDRNGSVDALDLATFAEYWLESR